MPTPFCPPKSRHFSTNRHHRTSCSPSPRATALADRRLNPTQLPAPLPDPFQTFQLHSEGVSFPPAFDPIRRLNSLTADHKRENLAD